MAGWGPTLAQLLTASRHLSGGHALRLEAGAPAMNPAIALAVASMSPGGLSPGYLWVGVGWLGWGGLGSGWMGWVGWVGCWLDVALIGDGKWLLLLHVSSGCFTNLYKERGDSRNLAYPHVVLVSNSCCRLVLCGEDRKHIYIYLYTYVCMHVCICIYIYIYAQRPHQDLPFMNTSDLNNIQPSSLNYIPLHPFTILF